MFNSNVFYIHFNMFIPFVGIKFHLPFKSMHNFFYFSSSELGLAYIICGLNHSLGKESERNKMSKAGAKW